MTGRPRPPCPAPAPTDHPTLEPDDLWTTRRPGTYLLLLRLDRPARIDVGRFGPLEFSTGWYVYVGSALGGLGPRLSRHARRDKRHHWHVDALRAAATLVAVAARPGRERVECVVAERVRGRPGGHRPVPGFGASDCRCAGHLLAFAERPDLALGDDWLVSTDPPTFATPPARPGTGRPKPARPRADR